MTLNQIVRKYSSKPNDQIALYASSLTRNPMPCSVIRAIASQLGLAVVDRVTRGRSGQLFVALDAIPNNHPLKPLARFFELHTWENGGEVLSTNGEESQIPGVDSFDVVVGFGSVATMISSQALNQNPPDTRFEQLRLGMIEAAGGLVFASQVTSTMVQAARAAIIVEDQQESERIQAEQQQALLRARKNQTYSALIDAARWVESQNQCPTRQQVIDYLTPHLPTEA